MECHVANPDPQAKDDDVKATAWTLRFKHGKHTILLLAEPLTPFSSLKTELLDTLRERYPSGLSSSTSPEPLPIPSSIHEVLLGIPVDSYEPSKGWVEITTDGGLKESPRSLGLKDGCMIAFTFIEGEQGDETVEFHVEFSSYEDQYPEDMADGAA
jgi:hypothetical protein